MSKSKATVEAEEQRFAILLAQGVTQTDAFKAIRPRSRNWEPASVTNKASEFARRASVQARVREALRASKLSELDSIPEWHARVQADIETAREDGAHASVMTGNRMIGQSLGAVQQNVVLDATSLMDDNAIINRLAGGDEHKAAILRAIIGADDFEQETPKQ